MVLEHSDKPNKLRHTRIKMFYTEDPNNNKISKSGFSYSKSVYNGMNSQTPMWKHL